jgi:two-component SAPR family response regulator
MFQHPSRSEDLVLKALQINEALSLEQIAERVPDLNWNDLFQAVDALSRRGDLILRRKGFAYYASLPRMSQVSA